MMFGSDLIKSLESEMATLHKSIDNRWDRINNGMTDIDDCFVSMKAEDRALSLCKDKISLIKDGGTAWFKEYATLDGKLVDAKWCKTKYGTSLRAEMPDGRVVWTTAITKKGLAKKGLKMVECRRPAWYTFHSPHRGMMGVYTGSYILFPSDWNYATGEAAGAMPLEIRDYE